jgi:hypothetical protein
MEQPADEFSDQVQSQTEDMLPAEIISLYESITDVGIKEFYP